MYVGPYEVDFFAPSGVRKIVVIDTSHNISFIRVLVNLLIPMAYSAAG